VGDAKSERQTFNITLLAIRVRIPFSAAERIVGRRTHLRRHDRRGAAPAWFSRTRKSHSGDRTDWLGREDSNLRMAGVSLPCYGSIAVRLVL
jgi:hypothetical protein